MTRRLVSIYCTQRGGFVCYNGEDHHAQAENILRCGGRHLISYDFKPEDTDEAVKKSFEGFIEGYGALQTDLRDLLGLREDS